MAGPDTPAESTRSEKNARYLWPLGLTTGYPEGGWELRFLLSAGLLVMAEEG